MGTFTVHLGIYFSGAPLDYIDLHVKGLPHFYHDPAQLSDESRA